MDLYKHPRLKGSAPSIHFQFVYLLAIIFSYHTLLVSYNLSSFLGRTFSPSFVGMLYGVGSLLSALALFNLPYLLSRFGNVVTGIVVMVGAVVSLLLLGLSSTPPVIILATFAFIALNPLSYLTIDIFSETLIGAHEGDTGSRRGLTLSLMGAAAMIAPLSMGFIMGEGSHYGQLFAASAGVGLLYIALTIGMFRHFNDPQYTKNSVRDLLTSLCKNRNITTVVVAHFLLQLFFAWMVIYVPLYLTTVVGFSWPAVALVLSAGLAAYVVCEYPIGVIADKYLGEQEMMALGFLILAISVGALGTLGEVGVVGWMLFMFLNRVGASLVEVTTESYFFKQVDGEDAPLMSLFRMLRPIAQVAGALIGSLILTMVSFTLFFVVCGLILTIGIFIPRYLIDTK